MLEDDKELQKAFYEETLEHIEKLENEILELENNYEDKTLINSIFRSYHTIKASAAYMKNELLQTVSHKVENLLDEVRKEKIKINSDIVNILFNSIDLIKKILLGDKNKSKKKVEDFLISLKNLKKESNNGENFKFIKKDLEDNDYFDDNYDDNLKNKYLLFQIANALFAVNLSFVEEITKIVKGTFIPYVEKYITSLINVRGELVPLIDVRIKFSLRDKLNNSSKIIILKHKESLIGLKVDGIKQIIEVFDKDIKKLNNKFNDLKSEYIKGFFLLDTKPVIILNLDTFLQREVSYEY